MDFAWAFVSSWHAHKESNSTLRNHSSQLEPSKKWDLNGPHLNPLHVVLCGKQGVGQISAMQRVFKFLLVPTFNDLFLKEQQQQRHYHYYYYSLSFGETLQMVGIEKTSTNLRL